MAMASPDRFRDLTFDGFRELATADGLSRYQRIGFPDAYRDGYEAAIFRDVLGKLTNLSRRDQTVFDIGCGCSDFPSLSRPPASGWGTRSSCATRRRCWPTCRTSR